MRGKEISVAIRAQVEILSKNGLSQREIARQLNIALSSVSKTLRRIQEEGHYRSRKRTGRPPKTSWTTNRLMHRIAVSNPYATSSEIASRLPSDCHISPRTIRRRLQLTFHLRAYKPAKKPRLSEKNRRDRLTFCQRYRHWTPSMWSRVMFSDETMIVQFRPNNRYVRRPPKQRHNQRYTTTTVRNAPSAMVWGAICASGRCGLYIIPKGETVRAKNYLQIIQEKVPTFMQIKGTDVFQHDGAPAHTAKIVKNWLRDCPFDVLTPWPGQSPDLNPIENCWVKLKERVAAKQVSSYEELVGAIKSAWTMEIHPEYCEKLVSSMPRRIEACIAAGGRSTKY